MQNSSKILFLEINRYNFTFFVANEDRGSNCKIIHKLIIPQKGFDNSRISNYETALNFLKENIYLIEQKLNFTFKEIILILENFNTTYLNLSGFKKLNGTQISKEDIIYILNTLKFSINEIEKKKFLIHIFNSKFILDYKEVENLPIGLFGDFYSHELSLSLIDQNEYRNLIKIFDNCNLRIKKILLRSFIKGAFISDNNRNLSNFFIIQINSNHSKIIYFENDSLKFEQEFNFGMDIVLRDICKITLLEKDKVELILDKINFQEKISEDELVEEELFEKGQYRKIKKNLIYEIAHARIKEILNLMIFENINLNYYFKSTKVLFFEDKTNFQSQNLGEIFKSISSTKNELDFKFLKHLTYEKMINTLNQLVHYGWKKEAIPFTQSKKSIITRFFDTFFS